jgi:hypothetical protein
MKGARRRRRPLQRQDLEYVEPRQNGNLLASGDLRAFRRDDEETVGVREGSDVAGALPTQWADFGGKPAGSRRYRTWPFQPGWEEMGKARIFLKRLG